MNDKTGQEKGRRLTLGRPSFLAALRLTCPYCRATPLRKEGSWFDFRAGCERCDYRYEREVGYYTGASWMINFPVICLLGVLVAWWLVVAYPELDALLMAAVVSVLVISVGIGIFPLCQALWLYFDHSFHPLHDDDRLSRQANDTP